MTTEEYDTARKTLADLAAQKVALKAVWPCEAEMPVWVFLEWQQLKKDIKAAGKRCQMMLPGMPCANGQPELL